MNPAVRYYDNCAERIPIPAERIVRGESGLSAVFDAVRQPPKKDRAHRYCLKLAAAWSHPDLPAVSVRVMINGGVLLSDFLPLDGSARYISFPPGWIQDGPSKFEMDWPAGSSNIPVVGGIEIIRQSAKLHMTVRSCPDFVWEKESFVIRLNLIYEPPKIKLDFPEKVFEYWSRDGESFVFRALKPAENVRISFNTGEEECDCVIEKVLPARVYDKALSGFAPGPLALDNSGGTEALLQRFTETFGGNFVLLGQADYKNPPPGWRAPCGRWADIVDNCVKSGLSFAVDGALPGLAPSELRNIAGQSFRWTLGRSPSAERAPAEDINSALSLAVSGPPSVMCRPAAEFHPVLAAARGTGKKFGVTAVFDGPLGAPFDEAALRRFRIALHTAYAYGADAVCADRAVFMTSFSQMNDRESEFCVRARAELRAFYKFTALNPRPGSPEVDLALLSGGAPVLGAWTPFSSAGVSGADGKAVFTASPFGQADILRPGSARIFKYKAAAFAGPCLMTPEIFDSLVKYVSGGGTLFIAGYNFLVSPDSEKLIFDGKISALTGLTVKDGGVVAPEGAARLPDKFHSFKKGAGTVIFGSFFDSRHDGARIKMIDDELRKIALEIRKRSGFVFSAADETAFSFNVWRGHGPSRIFITNIRAEDASGQETAFEFHVNGKKISGALPPAETAALAV